MSLVLGRLGRYWRSCPKSGALVLHGSKRGKRLPARKPLGNRTHWLTGIGVYYILSSYVDGWTGLNRFHLLY